MAVSAGRLGTQDGDAGLFSVAELCFSTWRKKADSDLIAIVQNVSLITSSAVPCEAEEEEEMLSSDQHGFLADVRHSKSYGSLVYLFGPSGT